MHDNDFLELSKHKIISVDKVTRKNNVVDAVLTTSHFKRITTSHYTFNYDDFILVITRRYF